MSERLLPFALLSVVACAQPTSTIIEPLRVIYWSPGSGAYCVDPHVAVSAMFSDDILPESLSPESFFLRGDQGPVEAVLEYDQGTFTVLLTPVAPLAFDREYAAVATTDIESGNHGKLAMELRASFVTMSRTGCTPPLNCQPPDCCFRPSDCPGTQICVNMTCIDECVEDRDCFRGTCDAGACVPLSTTDDGGGDPPGGDPGAGDPLDGDPGAGDPLDGDPLDGDPGAGDPLDGDPGAGDPLDGDPGAGDPTGGDAGGDGEGGDGSGGDAG